MNNIGPNEGTPLAGVKSNNVQSDLVESILLSIKMLLPLILYGPPFNIAPFTNTVTIRGQCFTPGEAIDPFKSLL